MRLWLWGGGGHGKVISDLARALGHEVIGAIDQAPQKLGQQVEPGGACVRLLQDDLLAHLDAHDTLPEAADGVLLGVGHNGARLAFAERLGDAWLPALIHPDATSSPSARVGAGSVVLAGAVLNAASQVGRAVIVNTGAIVEHDCEVGDGAHLSPRATLCGAVRVGRRAWIGASAVVIPLRSVGDDAVVGAGAVVVRDVSEGVTIVGNPARALR